MAAKLGARADRSAVLMTVRVRPLGAVALLLVAFLANGCDSGLRSSGSPSSTTAGSPSAIPAPTDSGSAGTSGCDLISIDQMVEATGGLDVVLATPLEGVVGCAYEVADGSAVLGFEFIDDAYWDQTAAAPHLNLNVGTESIFFSNKGGFLIVLVRDGLDQFAVTVKVPRESPVPALGVAKSMAGYLLAQM